MLEKIATRLLLIPSVVVVILMVLTSLNVAAAEQTTQTKQPTEQVNSPFKLYSVLVEDFYAMTKFEGSKWQSAVDRLDYERVLELPELKATADYLRHAEVLQSYVDASQAYLVFLENLYENTERKFITYGLSEQQVKPVIDNLLSTYQVQKSTLVSLLNVHIKYGQQMLDFLGFLQKHQDQWQLKQGQMKMDDKKLAKKYNQMIDQMVASEDAIEIYAQQLNFELK